MWTNHALKDVIKNAGKRRGVERTWVPEELFTEKWGYKMRMHVRREYNNSYHGNK